MALVAKERAAAVVMAQAKMGMEEVVAKGPAQARCTAIVRRERRW